MGVANYFVFKKKTPTKKRLEKGDESMKKRTIFTLGALLGGAAALFLTPKSGKELQLELLKHVEELQQKIKEFDQDLFKTQCKEQLEDIKEMINEFEWNRSLQQVDAKVAQVTSRLQNLREVIDEHKAEANSSLRLNDELEDIEMLETLQELEDLEEVEFSEK